MEKYYEDREYFQKVSDILDHPEFLKMQNIVHHEGNRMIILFAFLIILIKLRNF